MQSKPNGSLLFLTGRVSRFHLEQGEVHAKADGQLWLFSQLFAFVLLKIQILLFLNIMSVGKLRKIQTRGEMTCNERTLMSPPSEDVTAGEQRAVMPA